ncbi:MAG: hypothetical protein E7192_08070 [Erysipelotrichaceae bacterium]|nr:hypothetical protein [Erysipelotrichaceae bacterium]
MEKTILHLLIALLITAATSMKLNASFGTVSLIIALIDSMIWLLKRVYKEEKTPSHPTKD